MLNLLIGTMSMLAMFGVPIAIALVISWYEGIDFPDN